MQLSKIDPKTQLQLLNGRYQLIVDSVETFTQIPCFPPTHWAANSAPTHGLSSNDKFLSYLDSDENQRILPSELIEACQWLMESLNDLNGCIQGSSAIALSCFRTDTPTGRQLKEVASIVLQNLNKDSGTIHLENVQERTKIVQQGASNGDGILPPSVLEGEEQQFVIDSLTIFDGLPDITGEIGIHEALLERISSSIDQWRSWSKECPSKDWTPSMLSALRSIESVIDQHFIDAQTSTQEPQLNPPPLLLLQHDNIDEDAWVHPEHRTLWATFWRTVLQPLNISTLTLSTWESLWWDAQHYERWLNARPDGNFDAISTDRLNALASRVDIQASIKTKLDLDKSVSTTLLQLSKLEKTLLFQQNLRTFINSFVSFSNFYDPKARSMPEVGSLLLDGRWFRLVVHVPNKDKHMEQAKNSGFFLLYLSVAPSSPHTTIAVAVTGAERGDLHIGKKGVFYDNSNTQHTAEVIDMVDNPINIKEALLKPLEKVQQLVTKRVEKFGTEQEKQIEEHFAVQPNNNAWMSGGVTLAALSSSFAYLIQTLTSIEPSSILIVIIAPLSILTIFSSLVAGWKLHRRDLGPLLEASGWGINHPLRVPEWASEVFTLGTHVPTINQGSTSDMLMVFEHTANPYGNIKRIVMWVSLIVLTICIWWRWSELLNLLQSVTAQ